MDASPAIHLTDQTLSLYGLGELDDRAAEAVNEHLRECSACRKRVAEISSDSFLRRDGNAQNPSGQSTTGPSRAGGTPSSRGTSLPAPLSADSLLSGLAHHPDYQIKRELARGGMGVVYLAHNTLMGRDEALKVMGEHLTHHPGVRERFLREIRAVARLRHPNIVTAYHATRLGESIVLAMEYVDGLDLSKLVKTNGPMPIAHACSFAYQAALGLQHAHEEGLVHRDLKPHNLILARMGDRTTIKILDFGLAKAAREEEVEGGLTAPGQALGTPDYIAPEQIIDALTADIRADIYSLGGTLYYLLTGSPPFQSKSLYDLYQAHISRNADPLNLVRPEVPAELAALVAKMMAKDPSRRFQTPGEVAQALAPYFEMGNAALQGPRTEVTQVDPANLGPSMAETTCATPQQETEADRQIVRPMKAEESSAFESRWEGVIRFPETDGSQEVAPDVVPRRWPSWVWPSLAAGVLMLGLIAAWMGAMFKDRTPDAVVSRPVTAVPGELKVITNSIGMKLVLIPAGEFLMGSPDSDRDAWDAEKPLHRVRITRPFYLGVTEVTQGQYRAVTGANPSHFKGSDDLPVEQVSWNDAISFCDKLGEREGLKPSSPPGAGTQSGVDGYRLPTEAEWEYACRAASTTRYHFGDDAASVDEYAWYGGNSGRKTHPVGQKRPNGFGLYDMHGNVREWCWDGYQEDYYGLSPGADPAGPLQASERAFRGGCWRYDPRYVRSADRYGNTPAYRRSYLGFRVARVQSGP